LVKFVKEGRDNMPEFPVVVQAIIIPFGTEAQEDFYVATVSDNPQKAGEDLDESFMGVRNLSSTNDETAFDLPIEMTKNIPVGVASDDVLRLFVEMTDGD